MDKRTLVALVLMALVIVVTPRLFQTTKRAPAAGDDTTSVAASTRAPDTAISPRATTTPSVATPSAAAAPAPSAARPPVAPAVAAESTVLATSRAKMKLVSPGAAPVSVLLDDYLDLRPGRRSTMVLEQSRGPLLHYRIARGADTVALDTVRFAIQSGSPTTFTSTSPPITITYQPVGDGFRTTVRGTVGGAASAATLLVDLPRDLRTAEADTLDDLRHLSYAYRIRYRDVKSIGFSKLDTVVRADTGSLQWVTVRDKYWLVALVKTDTTRAASAGTFGALVMRGDTAIAKINRTASAYAVLPIVNGQFTFDLYAGPQSWQQMHAFGNDLENVNQYAGFFHPVVQPFATIVMRMLLWMRATTNLSYGWVLVIFGVVIRLLMWPLNQKAMRTSVQMQRIQPEMTAIQTKYKNEPEKLRESMVKLYKDHNMSPLSPLLGCLPMLLPMPVLWALYFVFQNTIEFRGVQFLWLPDISLRDPYYIIPVVMGLSMFVLSWIGMRSAPPNPQTKMMSYMMPVMFTVLFLNFASGLNLYYAVQNIAALPQQWIVSRERAKAGTGTATKTAIKPSTGAAKRSG